MGVLVDEEAALSGVPKLYHVRCLGLRIYLHLISPVGHVTVHQTLAGMHGVLSSLSRDCRRAKRSGTPLSPQMRRDSQMRRLCLLRKKSRPPRSRCVKQLRCDAGQSPHSV